MHSTEEAGSLFNADNLLDVTVSLIRDIDNISKKNIHVYLREFRNRFGDFAKNLDKERIHPEDFEKKERIGKGGLGEVYRAIYKKTDECCALKILKKYRVASIRAACFVLEERNALVELRSSCWVTDIIAAFQDEHNLYIAMEYVPGGSLGDYMCNRSTVLQEKEAIFYTAQIILALEYVHGKGYIHRDVKPENLLICQDGNIKLADFGSCVAETEFKRNTEKEIAGTIAYSAPEVLGIYEDEKMYSFECDYWSVGVVVFEMLYFERPFEADNEATLTNLIMTHESSFSLPEFPKVSQEAIGFMKSLIADKSIRLGLSGPEEVKKHPWLREVAWNDVRSLDPPFIPKGSEAIIYSETADYSDESPSDRLKASNTCANNKGLVGNNLLFAGYYYNSRPNPKLWPITSQHQQPSPSNLSIPREILGNPSNDIILPQDLHKKPFLLNKIPSIHFNPGKIPLTDVQSSNLGSYGQTYDIPLGTENKYYKIESESSTLSHNESKLKGSAYNEEIHSATIKCNQEILRDDRGFDTMPQSLVDKHTCVSDLNLPTSKLTSEEQLFELKKCPEYSPKLLEYAVEILMKLAVMLGDKSDTHTPELSRDKNSSNNTTVKSLYPRHYTNGVHVSNTPDVTLYENSVLNGSDRKSALKLDELEELITEKCTSLTTEGSVLKPSSKDDSKAFETSKTDPFLDKIVSSANTKPALMNLAVSPKKAYPMYESRSMQQLTTSLDNDTLFNDFYYPFSNKGPRLSFIRCYAPNSLDLYQSDSEHLNYKPQIHHSKKSASTVRDGASVKSKRHSRMVMFIKNLVTSIKKPTLPSEPPTAFHSAHN